MQGTYEANGVRFRFPEFWEISEERSDDRLSITVSSPETSFWSLSLFFEAPQENVLMETALEAFRDEYEELDIYPADVTVGRRECVARDLEFLCYELINSAYLRVFRTHHFSALILYQGTDNELDVTKKQLEKISHSLEFLEDGFPAEGSSFV